jgi:hypothetical protein
MRSIESDPRPRHPDRRSASLQLGRHLGLALVPDGVELMVLRNDAVDDRPDHTRLRIVEGGSASAP